MALNDTSTLASTCGSYALLRLHALRSRLCSSCACVYVGVGVCAGGACGLAGVVCACGSLHRLRSAILAIIARRVARPASSLAILAIIVRRVARPASSLAILAIIVRQIYSHVLNKASVTLFSIVLLKRKR